MRIKYNMIISIILQGESKETIEDKFFELNLGNLDKAKEEKKIQNWEYLETERKEVINSDGSIGKEIL